MQTCAISCDACVKSRASTFTVTCLCVDDIFMYIVVVQTKYQQTSLPNYPSMYV